jgi:hypothetical protein
MHWSDHVKQKIANAPIFNDPWPHVVVTDLFPAELYADMQANLPAKSDMKELSWKTRQRFRLVLHDENKDNPSAPQFWKDFRYDFMPTMRAALETKFSVRGRSMESAIVHDEPGYALAPHTDMPHRLITAVMYLPADDSTVEQGTVILRSKEADPKGMDQTWDDRFEEAYTVPHLPNAALFFVRSNESFHAVRKTTTPRWTLSFDVLK